jgi:hypothetical protein
MPEKKMGQHVRQCVVVASCKLSHLILIHPQLGLGLLEHCSIAHLMPPSQTKEINPQVIQKKGKGEFVVFTLQGLRGEK